MHGTGELTVVYEVQAGIAVQRRSINSALIIMEQGYALSFWSGDRDRSETVSAVLKSALLITELFKSAAEGYKTKIVGLLYCELVDIEAI